MINSKKNHQNTIQKDKEQLEEERFSAREALAHPTAARHRDPVPTAARGSRAESGLGNRTPAALQAPQQEAPPTPLPRALRRHCQSPSSDLLTVSYSLEQSLKTL